MAARIGYEGTPNSVPFGRFGADADALETADAERFAKTND
jgi:hypothetical protein